MSVDLDEPLTITLPFDDNKQLAILGHLVENHQFFCQSVERILPGWFKNSYATQIYEAKVQFFREFNRSPTTEELRNLPVFLKTDQRSIQRVNDTILAATNMTQEFGLDALRPELTAWLHSQLFEIGFRNAYLEYKKKNTKLAYSTVDEMVQKIKATRFEQDDEEKFDNPIEEFRASRREYSNALTTGLTIFDRLLTPKAASGSLLPGDLSIILAPTNIGKTTSMITTVVHNVLMGKHVLLITHEGRPSDIKEKIYCAMLGMNALQLLDIHKSKKGQRRIEHSAKWLSQYLTYIPMNKPGLTVEEVAAVVRKKQEERFVQRKGLGGYDMLVDDYPAKVTTAQAAKGMSKRERDEIVYNHFEQMGLQHKFHVLCAIQTNREGSKVNKGQREDRLLTMEDVQESWGPMTAATNVWTINRSPHDKMRNRLVYYIDKSRSSETGFAVVCKTDFSTACTHSNALGATFYRSASTHSDKLDQYLEQYLHQEMPEHLLVG